MLGITGCSSDEQNDVNRTRSSCSTEDARKGIAEAMHPILRRIKNQRTRVSACGDLDAILREPALLKKMGEKRCRSQLSEDETENQLQAVLQGRNLPKLCDWRQQDRRRSEEIRRAAQQRSAEQEHYRSLNQDETDRSEARNDSSR